MAGAISFFALGVMNRQRKRDSPMPTRIPRANRLLATLLPPEYERIRPHLQSVPLLAGSVLHRPRQKSATIYFPTRGVLSLLTDVEGGRSIEVGMVGTEGMAGLQNLL